MDGLPAAEPERATLTTTYQMDRPFGNLVAFVASARLGDLSEQPREDLKLGVPDALGFGIGAPEVPPILKPRTSWTVWAGRALATLTGRVSLPRPRPAAGITASALVLAVSNS